jgi:hypothetical protein
MNIYDDDGKCSVCGKTVINRKAWLSDTMITDEDTGKIYCGSCHDEMVEPL